MRFPTKDEISVRFAQHPFLDSLVRLFLYQVWFRTIVLLAIPAASAVLLLPVKLWRVSPAGSLPEVRISLLDWLQSRALRNTALKESKAGRIPEALYSWQAAIANHPADLALIRGYLRDCHRKEVDPSQLGAILVLSRRLHQWGHTNLADLELTAPLFDQLGLDEMLDHVFAGKQSALTPPLRALHLKSLFRRGRMASFGRLWNEWENEALSNDPELALYHAAYVTGWSTSAGASDARARIDEAKRDPRHMILAHQLQLRLSLQSGDLKTYQASLQQLQALTRDTLADNLGHWRLLAFSGARDEATAAMRNYSKAPGSSRDMIHYAQALFEFGLADEARDYLKRYLPTFGYAEGGWVVYSEILIQQKLWPELRNLAIELRLMDGLGDVLGAYSHYLEGRAELGQDRFSSAETSFQKCAESAVVNPDLSLLVANRLVDLRRYDPAKSILDKLEGAQSLNPDYWLLRVAVADQLKLSDLLLRCAQQAFQLEPGNIVSANNYAAALVINRNDPAEAIKLTLAVLERMPNAALAKINHSLALLQNDRATAADELLAGLSPGNMTSQEAQAYYTACFEVCVVQQRWELAGRFNSLIETEKLFPIQKTWIEKLRSNLPGPQHP